MLLRRYHEVSKVDDHAATSDGEEIRESLEDLTVAELRELASASSIEGYSNMKKDELIQAIESLE